MRTRAVMVRIRSDMNGNLICQVMLSLTLVYEQCVLGNSDDISGVRILWPTPLPSARRLSSCSDQRFVHLCHQLSTLISMFSTLIEAQSYLPAAMALELLSEGNGPLHLASLDGHRTPELFCRVSYHHPHHLEPASFFLSR